MTTQTKQLAPGSEAARLAGCTCPVLDNQHGRGMIIDGRVVYVYNCGCPLHDKATDNGKRD